MSYWTEATEEAKLAQIDAAIELGLTAKQTGVLLGTNRDKVLNFAQYRGRHFPRPTRVQRQGWVNRQGVRSRARLLRAYFTDGKPNLWTVH